MIGFFIKKAFFDGWDNLIGLVVHNLVYLLMLFGLYGAFTLFASEGGLLLGLGAMILLSAAYSLYSSAVAWQTYLYSDYKREGFKGLKEGFARLWRHGVFHFVVNTLLCMILFFTMPMYLQQNSAVGFFLGLILFWTYVIVSLALQYFFPLACRMPGDRPLKTFRKCFIILVDNLGTSLFLALFSAVSFVFTVVLVGLVPSISGILLNRQVALKLLLLKYDYLEENPDADRKKIPWEELLFDEREKVGHRSLKNMIFPWKD